MAKIKTERLTKGTRARELANRKLPNRLAEYRSLQQEKQLQAVKVKQPPRLVQRQRRLKALAEAKAKRKELRERAGEKYGIPTATPAA